MCTPVFGLSTTPVMDIKSEMRQQIERDMLALLDRTPRQLFRWATRLTEP